MAFCADAGSVGRQDEADPCYRSPDRIEMRLCVRSAGIGTETMNHDEYEDTDIAAILKRVRTVAVLGASANPARPSHGVTRFLIGKGYEVYPVNPGLAGNDLLGRPVYARLAEVPVPIDMVDIFRNVRAVPGIAEEVLRLEPLPQVVWMQLAIRDDEAAARLEAAGITVVMNRCPAIEYPRLARYIERTSAG